MWCVTPVIGPRRVLKDTKLFGYFIPKNTTVLINIYSVNNDPEIFPEPRVFKPERFLKDGAFQSNENLILFGKGKIIMQIIKYKKKKNYKQRKNKKTKKLN